MSNKPNPSAFSTYASKFLSGNLSTAGVGGQQRGRSSRNAGDGDAPLFRSEIPDPYASRSRSRSSSTHSLPRLAGSSTTLPSASALLFNADPDDDDDDEGDAAGHSHANQGRGAGRGSGGRAGGRDSVGMLGVSRRVEMPGLDELRDMDDEEEGSEGEDGLDPFSSGVIDKGGKGKGKGKAVQGYSVGADSSLAGSSAPPAPPAAKKGWLAHQSVFPSRSAYGQPPLSEEDSSEDDDDDSDADSKPSDPPSPGGPGAHHAHAQGGGRDRKYHPELSSSSDDEDDEDYDDGLPIGFGPDSSYLPQHQRQQQQHQAKASKHHKGEALDDPLLPRGLGVGVIPQRLEVYNGRLGHWKGEVPLRKYKDAPWLALWLTSVLGVLIGLCFVWGATDPTPVPPTAPGGITYRTPFSTLLHTIPLLAVLVAVAVVLPLGFLMALKWAVRPVLMGTAVLIPFTLLVSAWWAFIASFEAPSIIPDTNTDGETNWWGTVGLRLLSLIPLGLAALSGRMVYQRWKRLNASVRVVELSTKLLLQHPSLLVLTPALLAAFTILSIPYLTLVLRLLLIGYYRHPKENTWIWNVKPYAGILLCVVTGLWLWSWVIVRGIGRVVTAAVVGEWYFHREETGRPEMTDVTVAALHRATGPSLGSICLSSLIVAVARMAGRGAAQARKVVHPRSKLLPTPLAFLSNLTPFFSIVASVLDQLNGYALIYIGITGDAFWPSARKAVALAGSRQGSRLLDYTFIKLLLTLTSTAMAVGAATIGYLYAVHALSAPAHAPLTALLCGGVPFLAIRASAGVLSDASDAVFICSAIDREAGTQHCPEALAAFAADPKPNLDVV